MSVLVVGLLLVSSACSREAKDFDDVEALAVALENANVSCHELRVSGPGELVKEQGSCGDGSDIRALYVFESTADRDEWISVGSAFGDVVVGPRWAVVPARRGPASSFHPFDRAQP